MQAHGASKDFKVNVKVNSAPQEDLARILAGIRADYEAIIEKNRQSLDAWFQQQVIFDMREMEKALLNYPGPICVFSSVMS